MPGNSDLKGNIGQGGFRTPALSHNIATSANKGIGSFDYYTGFSGQQDSQGHATSDFFTHYPASMNIQRNSESQIIPYSESKTQGLTQTSNIYPASQSKAMKIDNRVKSEKFFKELHGIFSNQLEKLKEGITEDMRVFKDIDEGSKKRIMASFEGLSNNIDELKNDVKIVVKGYGKKLEESMKDQENEMSDITNSLKEHTKKFVTFTRFKKNKSVESFEDLLNDTFQSLSTSLSSLTSDLVNLRSQLTSDSNFVVDRLSTLTTQQTTSVEQSITKHEVLHKNMIGFLKQQRKLEIEERKSEASGHGQWQADAQSWKVKWEEEVRNREVEKAKLRAIDKRDAEREKELEIIRQELERISGRKHISIEDRLDATVIKEPNLKKKPLKMDEETVIAKSSPQAKKRGRPLKNKIVALTQQIDDSPNLHTSTVNDQNISSESSLVIDTSSVETKRKRRRTRNIGEQKAEKLSQANADNDSFEKYKTVVSRKKATDDKEKTNEKHKVKNRIRTCTGQGEMDIILLRQMNSRLDYLRVPPNIDVSNDEDEENGKGESKEDENCNKSIGHKQSCIEMLSSPSRKSLVSVPPSLKNQYDKERGNKKIKRADSVSQSSPDIEKPKSTDRRKVTVTDQNQPISNSMLTSSQQVIEKASRKISSMRIRVSPFQSY